MIYLGACRREKIAIHRYYIELADFLQKILTFRARLPRCGQSFKSGGSANGVLITDAWCDSADDELSTAHDGIGSGKQHYK
jgi:hypothetical protein